MRIPLTISFFLIASPLLAQNRVSCLSHGNASQFCQADTHNGVLLQRELSNGACQQGSTWNYDRRGITVSGGCGADFLVTGEPGAYNAGSRGGDQNYGNHNYGNAGGDHRNDNPERHDDGDDRERHYAPRLPVGTQLQIRLEQLVDPRSAKVGDLIPATLVSDLVINGQRVARQGTPVTAKVTRLRQNATYPLTVSLAGLDTHGNTYTLVTSAVHSTRDSQTPPADNNQGGLGGVFGAILGGGVQAQLPAGSVYTFRLLATSRPAPQH